MRWQYALTAFVAALFIALPPLLLVGASQPRVSADISGAGSFGAGMTPTPAVFLPRVGAWRLEPAEWALPATATPSPRPAPRYEPPRPQAQSTGALSEAEMDALLLAAGAPAEWWADMRAIAACESRWSPGAVGDRGQSLGLYQLWTGWFQAGEDPFDALTNTRVAVRVREARGRFGGQGGWTCAAKVGAN